MCIFYLEKRLIVSAKFSMIHSKSTSLNKASSSIIQPTIVTKQYLYVQLHNFQKLINLDGSKNLLVEPECTQETNGTGDQINSERDQSHVSKVKSIGCRTVHLKLLKVMEGVPKDVKSRGSSCNKRAPPPMIILSA